MSREKIRGILSLCSIINSFLMISAVLFQFISYSPIRHVILCWLIVLISGICFNVAVKINDKANKIVFLTAVVIWSLNLVVTII